MVAPALALDEGLDADLEHMRRPRRLWKDAGTKGFFTLNAIIGGNVLTAQTFPILVVDMALRLLASSGATGAVAPLYLTTIATGFVSTIVVGLMGLARRAQLRQGWILALTPIYWALSFDCGVARAVSTAERTV